METKSNEDITNDIDISVLDNEFFVSILNTILELKRKEAKNGLQKY